MSKRLCKMNRKQIAESLGDIHRLEAAPKFICRSCARASASKGGLCKPMAISSSKYEHNQCVEQQADALVAQVRPHHPAMLASSSRAEKAAIVQRVVERVKEKKLAEKVAIGTSKAKLEMPAMIDLTNKKALKKVKKAIKKHYKQQKKLLKLAKKQQESLKRLQKWEGRHLQWQKQLSEAEQSVAENRLSVH